MSRRAARSVMNISRGCRCGLGSWFVSAIDDDVGVVEDDDGDDGEEEEEEDDDDDDFI